MTKEKSTVPRLRFPGFTDAWKQRKLGEVAEIVGGGTPSTSINEYWNGDIDWYSPAEIGKKIYVSSSQRKISDLGLEKSSAKMLPIGTVLFTSRAGIGNTAILAKEGTTNQGFQSIIPKKDSLDSYFIFSLTNMLKKHGEVIGAGSTFVEVSGKQMSQMPLSLPTLPEQEAIGSFFSDLDQLITLHQRKLDDVKELKKALLQKMFPKGNGNDFPDLRFPEFTDAWKQRKLGEVAISFDYGLNSAATEYDGENKYLRITDIDDDSREFNISNLTSPEINLFGLDEYRLSIGDILFARTGASVGKSYIYRSVDGKVYFAGFLIRVKIKDTFNPDFVFQNTLTSNYERFISITSMRSGQPGVNAQEYSNYEIMFPTLSEQEAIGSFFSDLDQLITLHQRQLDHLKLLKKALLQQMFI
ncbi:restriction endonuclease subunit S [Streptococcus suis]|nr:restriction endonuclease subunit S [Streptococcus suis]